MPASGLNAGAVRVAGTGAIWKAPVGSTLPTDSTTALDAAFKNLGYQATGFTVTPSYKTTNVTGWQTLQPLLVVTTENSKAISFEAMEQNAETLSLAWGGAAIVPGTAGAYTIAVPEGQLDEFALVIGWVDGAISQRIVCPRVALSSLPTIKYVRTDAVSFPLEVQVLKPADGSPAMTILGVDANVNPAA